MNDETEMNQTEPSTEEVVKENIKSPAIWKRLLYMLLFMIVWGIAEFVLFWIVVFQFFYSFTGKRNEPLQRFGRSTANFMAEIVRFWTYNTEEHPFPFGEWPEPEADGDGNRRRTPRRPSGGRKKSTARKKAASKKTTTKKTTEKRGEGPTGGGATGG